MKDKLKSGLFFGIIILGAVSVFVFALSARDEAETEAEVLTWSKTHEEPPEAVWYYDGEVTHRYLLDESEPNEPSETNSININSNVPAIMRFKKEPCESNELKITDYQQELRDWQEGYSLEELPTLLEKIIPTWPDYIELEKDLILRYDFPEPNNPYLIYFPFNKRTISKGTKIYFEEDD